MRSSSGISEAKSTSCNYVSDGHPERLVTSFAIVETARDVFDDNFVKDAFFNSADICLCSKVRMNINGER